MIAQQAPRAEAAAYESWFRRYAEASGQVACPEGQHWMQGDPEPCPIRERWACPQCGAAV